MLKSFLVGSFAWSIQRFGDLPLGRLSSILPYIINFFNCENNSSKISCVWLCTGFPSLYHQHHSFKESISLLSESFKVQDSEAQGVIRVTFIFIKPDNHWLCQYNMVSGVLSTIFILGLLDVLVVLTRFTIVSLVFDFVLIQTKLSPTLSGTKLKIWYKNFRREKGGFG